MKYFVFLCFMVLLPSFAVCITVEELGRLAELKTSDDLILQIIEKEKLQKPINADDVIYLKERGLSESIIDYLWKQSFNVDKFLPPQEGESKMIGENLRQYEGRDANGKKIVILTNLDENGRRMGPPPPPRPEIPSQPEPVYYPEPPAEIYIPTEMAAPVSYEEEFPEHYPASFPSIYDAGYYPLLFIQNPVHSRHFNKSCVSTRPHGSRHNIPRWGAGRTAFQSPYTVNVHGPVKWPGSQIKPVGSGRKR